MKQEEQDKTEPEAGGSVDADAYYGDEDADGDIELDFLGDEDADGGEKHSA